MKKMKFFSRISAFILCLVVLTGCSSTRLTDINQIKSRANEYTPEDNGIVNMNVAYKSNVDSAAILTGKELTIENETFALYIGEGFEVYVFDKRTGEVFCTNPAYIDYTAEERNGFVIDAQKIMLSQIQVQYYDPAQKLFSLYSYPDAYSPNTQKRQVYYEIVDNKLIVNYGIGTSMADFPLMKAISVETYEYYNQKMEEMIARGEITVIDQRTFVNNYTYYNYAMMNDADKAEYGARYPALETEGILYGIKPNLANKIMNDMLRIYAILEIGPEQLLAEEERLGKVIDKSTPAYFTIPLTYELHGSSLLTSIDMAEIIAPEGFMLTDVKFLQSFGATRQQDDGYMFLPDGSGMIVMNNEPTRSMSTISMPFYGSDFAKEFVLETSIAIDTVFPVFGIKKNNTAIFAIVENGETYGGVAAEKNSGYLPYNVVFPYFTYMNSDSFGVFGVSRMFSTEVPQIKYVVRYNFLYDDYASYSGMARFYQQYLEQKGILTKKNETADIPLDINLLGTITKTVNKIGLPFQTEYPITTFDEAEEIMGLFKTSGINNLSLVYSGAINGGVDFKSPKKISFQSELGGIKGYNDLYKYQQSVGYKLYTQVDFTRVFQKGNGVSIGISSDDTSRYLRKTTAWLTDYYPANLVRAFESPSAIINPLIYDDIADGFLKSYKKADNKELYLSTLGSLLNSNFNQDMELNRQDTKILTQDLLKKIKDNGYSLKLDSGNQYILPYVDSLINVETTSSSRRIESYSIPFVGMVLKGYVPFTTMAINRSGNKEKTLLEAVESGAGLHYIMMYANQLALNETHYMKLFSINYQIWVDEIIEIYNRLNADLGHLTYVRIVNHERVAEEVSCVTYENGSKVYVNYSHDDFNVSGKTVASMSYLVIN